MKFIWNDKYNVGINQFDQQHRYFLELANQIYDLRDSGTNDKNKLESITKKMIDYAHFHLDSEEEMFRKYHYPEANEHIKAHNLYRQKVQDFYQKIQTSKESENIYLLFELVDFTVDWFTGHILSIDKQYSSFLRPKIK